MIISFGSGFTASTDTVGTIKLVLPTLNLIPSTMVRVRGMRMMWVVPVPPRSPG